MIGKDAYSLLFWRCLLQERLIIAQEEYRRRNGKPAEKRPRRSAAEKDRYYYLSAHKRQFYLSQREHECASLLINGLTLKQMGATLGISERTVEYYVARIRKRVQCHNKQALITFLHESSFIPQTNEQH